MTSLSDTRYRDTSSSEIIISKVPLDLAALNLALQNSSGESGAAVIFTGAVRAVKDSKGLTGMTLEHYPGMTENQLQTIVDEATERWQLSCVKVAHRVGFLQPGEPIVFVGVSALHRQEAFDAAQFIMDYLKQKATFWKKEHFGENSFWVKAKQSDQLAADKWS